MFLVAASILCAITMSYLALFFTVDGLRVFAVICCASYIFILSRTLSLMIEKRFSKP